MFELIWDILGKISTVCGIVGLPIALVQIYQIKSRAKATEEAMNRFLVLEKSSILNNIYETIIKQEDAVSKIQGMLDITGISQKKIKEDCQGVVSAINMCIYNMPVEHEELSEIMQKAIFHMRNYINTQDKTELLEVADVLYVVISNLKKIRAVYLKNSISDISQK